MPTTVSRLAAGLLLGYSLVHPACLVSCYAFMAFTSWKKRRQSESKVRKRRNASRADRKVQAAPSCQSTGAVHIGTAHDEEAAAVSNERAKAAQGAASAGASSVGDLVVDEVDDETQPPSITGQETTCI